MKPTNGLLPGLIHRRKGIANTPIGRHIDNIQHAAVILNKKGSVLNTGNNYYSSRRSSGFSIHAEQDALTKTLRNFNIRRNIRRSNRKHTVYLLVIRTTLGNSYPCVNCVRCIASHPSIHVKRIYYSNNGIIEYVSLQSLINSNVNHVSKGNRHECCDEDESDEDEKNKRIIRYV